MSERQSAAEDACAKKALRAAWSALEESGATEDSEFYELGEAVVTATLAAFKVTGEENRKWREQPNLGDDERWLECDVAGIVASAVYCISHDLDIDNTDPYCVGGTWIQGFAMAARVMEAVSQVSGALDHELWWSQFEGEIARELVSRMVSERKKSRS